MQIVWKRAGLLAAMLASAAGCGSSVSVNSTVKGSVGGLVLDAIAGLPPLAGVAVTVISGGKAFTTTTDASGVFTVADVPGGSVIVKLVAKDHAPALIHETLAAAAGNFPTDYALSIGPVGLLPATAAAGMMNPPLSLRVVNQDGAPVPTARVTAHSAASYIDFASGKPVSFGTVEVGGNSAADGTIALTGLPDYGAIGSIVDDTITVNVGAMQVPSSGGTYQFFGLQKTFQALSLYDANAPSNTPTLVLAGPKTGLSVVAANIEGVVAGWTAGPTGSIVSAAGPAVLTFNQAVLPDSVHVILYTEFGVALATVSATPMVSGNQVTISFSKSLDAGARYNLQIHAAALSPPHREFDAIGAFFTATTSSPVTVAPTLTKIDPNPPGNDILVYFSEPIGVGNGHGDPNYRIPCVTYYTDGLDGNAGMTTAGEYNPNGSSFLVCDPNDPRPGLYLRPDEPVFGVSRSSVLTGFTTRWRLTVKPTTSSLCAAGYQCCTDIKSVYFVFSKNPDVPVKRVNGALVADVMPWFVPSLGCP